MELSCPKKTNKTFKISLALPPPQKKPCPLKKTFYALHKTPFGETGWLSNLYYLLAVQASNFLINHPFPNTVS